MAKFYGTKEGFDTYCGDRNYDKPPADAADVDAALLIASEWIDGRYGSSWRFRTLKTGGRAQEREWPRQGFTDAYGYAIPNDVIPREIEAATYEVALRQLQAPGSLFVDYTPAKFSSVSVSGAVSVQYREGSALDFQRQMPVVDSILTGLMYESGGSSLSGSRGRG